MRQPGKIQGYHHLLLLVYGTVLEKQQLMGAL